MRLFVTLALLSLPAPAFAGSTCNETLAGTDHVLTGMFSRQDRVVTEINTFPLFASDRRLAYISCPVIEADGQEATSCAIGILARQDGILVPTDRIEVAGCTADDDWSADCPDFTAEGFTQGNAARLAWAINRSAAQLCTAFDAQPVATLTPVAGPGESPPGLDSSSYFELFPDCKALGTDSANTCAKAIKAAGQPILGMFQARAGGRSLTCAVLPQGVIAACDG